MRLGKLPFGPFAPGSQVMDPDTNETFIVAADGVTMLPYSSANPSQNVTVVSRYDDPFPWPAALGALILGYAVGGRKLAIAAGAIYVGWVFYKRGTSAA